MSPLPKRPQKPEGYDFPPSSPQREELYPGQSEIDLDSLMISPDFWEDDSDDLPDLPDDVEDETSDDTLDEELNDSMETHTHPLDLSNDEFYEDDIDESQYSDDSTENEPEEFSFDSSDFSFMNEDSDYDEDSNEGYGLLEDNNSSEIFETNDPSETEEDSEPESPYAAIDINGEGLEWERNENGFEDSSDPFSTMENTDEEDWTEEDDTDLSILDDEIEDEDEMEDTSAIKSLSKSKNKKKSDQEKPKTRGSSSSEKDSNPLSMKISKIPVIGWVYSFIKNLYFKLVDLSFSLIMGILGILSRIPFIGKFFGAAKSAVNIVRKIASLFPLVFLILLLVFLNWKSVDSNTTSQLPDEAKFSISQGEFNKDNGTASAKVENISDVSMGADVTMTVYTWQPSLNPVTWVLHQEDITCDPTFVELQSGESKEIDFTCQGELHGMFARVSGDAK